MVKKWFLSSLENFLLSAISLAFSDTNNFQKNNVICNCYISLSLIRELFLLRSKCALCRNGLFNMYRLKNSSCIIGSRQLLCLINIFFVFFIHPYSLLALLGLLGWWRCWRWLLIECEGCKVGVSHATDRVWYYDRSKGFLWS